MESKSFQNLISLSEASTISNLSQDHLRRLAEQGKLEAKKIGRNWVTTKEAVEEYLEKRRPPGRPKQHLD
jgi:excisionase family DNA binding protein